MLAVAEADASARRGRGAVDLRRVVDEIAGTLARHRAAERIHVSTRGEVDVDLPGDQVRIVLFGLLENALKFSDGDVTVEIGGTDESVTVAIRDRGIGIDPLFLERRAFGYLTQQDASTTRLHGGLGIGLFTADRVTRVLGGHLRLANRRRGGVEAIIELPRWLPSTELSAASAQAWRN